MARAGLLLVLVASAGADLGAGQVPNLRGAADATAAKGTAEETVAAAPAEAWIVENATRVGSMDMEMVARAAADNASSLPMGTESEAEGMNMTSLVSVSRAGSCAAYGCGDFHHGRRCQCNSACGRYRNCCSDYQAKCLAHASREHGSGKAGKEHGSDKAGKEPGSAKAGKVLTLYHQTSPEIAKLILNSSFKPGRRGWCGGGIYFATDPEATEGKAIGTDSHLGFIIEAKVDVGRVLEMSSTCDLKMSGPKLWAQHYDSIRFDPGDGDEYVLYNSSRIVSMKAYSMKADSP